MNIPSNPDNVLQERRLAGVARLYGEDAFEKLQKAHVIVVGLGGVGSWAAEGLARSAVGEISLIDFDHISISNTNRQLHALEGEFGKSKVETMRERLQAINPELVVHAVDAFLDPENISNLIPPKSFVLDAADDFEAKRALTIWCVEHQIPFVICGAAGGKTDPTQIRVDDLAKATHDPILSKLRGVLRKQSGFEKDPKKKMKVPCVYSSQARSGVSKGGLACSGYGSSVTVTATFGFVAASNMIERIVLSKEAI